MNIYAVLLPASASFEHSFDRAMLIRQGFNWEAFLITPIWAARRRSWPAFGLWVIWTIAIFTIAFGLRLDAAAGFGVYLIGALAFGFEADLIEQSRLTNAGFLLQGLALGASKQEAELIYLSAHAKEIASGQARPSSDAPNRPSQANAEKTAPQDEDLLGLFPSKEQRA